MDKRLPILKARDVIRMLREIGFEEVRQTGSHLILKHKDGRMTLVPRHGGEDIGRGLLGRILHEIHLTPEDFSVYM